MSQKNSSLPSNTSWTRRGRDSGGKKCRVKGDYNALAPHGRMYGRGIAGFPKSAKRGRKRYKEGILPENVLSTFLLWLFHSRQGAAA